MLSDWIADGDSAYDIIFWNDQQPTLWRDAFKYVPTAVIMCSCSCVAAEIKGTCWHYLAWPVFAYVQSVYCMCVSPVWSVGVCTCCWCRCAPAIGSQGGGSVALGCSGSLLYTKHTQTAGPPSGTNRSFRAGHRTCTDGLCRTDERNRDKRLFVCWKELYHSFCWLLTDRLPKFHGVRFLRSPHFAVLHLVSSVCLFCCDQPSLKYTLWMTSNGS